MKIELIMDRNCISLKTYLDMQNRLVEEFSFDEIKITSSDTNRQRMKKLGINLLPAWLVNGDLLRINPGDYDLLKKKIKERLEIDG